MLRQSFGLLLIFVSVYLLLSFIHVSHNLSFNVSLLHSHPVEDIALIILTLPVHTANKSSLCVFQVKNGESRMRPRNLCVVVNGIMILFSLIIGGLEIFFSRKHYRVVFKGLSNMPMSFNHLLYIFIAFF